MADMMSCSKESFDEPPGCPSILLASDSDPKGSQLHHMLAEEGFSVRYAGDYSRLDSALREDRFDIVLLEVTGEHAVEWAVEAALRVKRGNAGQFVGYLADPVLEVSGLAGDAVFPRSAAKLAGSLRTFLLEDAGG